MRPGRFITLEGGEGVGKSTQARMLADALGRDGREVVLTREPGGTAGAEAIRALLLDRGQEWTARSEALLFAAARAEHVARIIRPALAAGQWVVCDRFIDSSRAYQGGEAGLSDADIMALHRVGCEGLLPDFTILLEAPEEQVEVRLAARDGGLADRIGARPAAFHRKVAARFRELAVAEPGRFALVDASAAPERVHGAVLAALAAFAAGDER